jgi:hypothetical protein
MTRTREQEKQRAASRWSGRKWTTAGIDLHIKSYCKDAKKEYLDAESYKQMTAYLTTRTGWKIRELEAWLAMSKFKTCKGNKVMGDDRARGEARDVGMGGPRAARARAVRGIRADLQKRAGGAENPVVTFAMVRELKENKKGLCGGAKAGVAAAILMAAAQEQMMVAMFEVGCGGERARDGVEEAQQWAVQAGWIGQAEAEVTRAAWREGAVRRGVQHQHIMIEMGVG